MQETAETVRLERSELAALLTRRQAAIILGVQPDTLELWARRACLPWFDVGGRMMFRRVDLQTFQDIRAYRAEKGERWP